MTGTVLIVLSVLILSGISMYGAWTVFPYRVRFANSAHRFLFTWVVISLGLKALVAFALCGVALIFFTFG